MAGQTEGQDVFYTLTTQLRQAAYFEAAYRTAVLPIGWQAMSRPPLWPCAGHAYEALTNAKTLQMLDRLPKQ